MNQINTFDTTRYYKESFFSDIYKKKFISLRHEYVKIIDNLSRENSSKEWWVSSPAFRFIQNDNIYQTIVIVESLKESLNENKIPNSIIVKNEVIKNFLRKNKKLLNIENCKIISKDINLNKFKYLVNSIKILFTFFAIKFFSLIFKRKNKKQLFLIDTYFVLNRSDNHRYYGNDFDKVLLLNKEYQLVPTFISHNIFNIYELKNLFKLLGDNKYFIKEKFLSFFDLIKIFLSIHLSIYRIKNKKLFFNNIDYSEILQNEIKYNKNYEQSFIGLMNYFFFNNLKKKNINLNKSINWFENQPTSKGWFLGINNFFPNSISIGYQGFTYFPEILSIFSTNQEYLSGISPKQITTIGNAYENLLNEFTNKITYKTGIALRFNYLKNLKFINFSNRKIDYVVFLTGIKEFDLEVIKWINDLSYLNTNFCIKSHPNFDVSSVSKKVYKNISFVKNDFLYLVENSKCVICTGPTSALLECISLGLNLLIPKITLFEEIMSKKVKIAKNQKFVDFQDFHECLESMKYIKTRNSQNVNGINNFFNLSESFNIDKLFRV